MQNKYFNINAVFYFNKNEDIKFSAQDTFLEEPSSCTLEAKIFESQIIKRFLGAKTPKGINRIVKII